MNNAPPVSFSKDPPLELRGQPGLSTSPYLVGYVSFGELAAALGLVRMGKWTNGSLLATHVVCSNFP